MRGDNDQIQEVVCWLVGTAALIGLILYLAAVAISLMGAR